MSAATRWTLIIVGFLGGSVIMMGVLIAASTSNRPAIIPGYYDRAVAYDGELAAAEASRRWNVTATIESGRVVVTARDFDGKPITHAKVRVTGVPRARASARFEYGLDELGDGSYTIAHAGTVGVHDLEIWIERDGIRALARSVAEMK